MIPTWNASSAVASFESAVPSSPLAAFEINRMNSNTDHSSDQLRSVSPESCVDESAQSGTLSRTAKYLSTKERITAFCATNATVSPPELASVSRKGSKKVARAVSPASISAPPAPQVYIRNTEEISALRGLQSHLRSNRSVCPPNTRMTASNRRFSSLSITLSQLPINPYLPIGSSLLERQENQIRNRGLCHSSS